MPPCAFDKMLAVASQCWTDLQCLAVELTFDKLVSCYIEQGARVLVMMLLLQPEEREYCCLMMQTSQDNDILRVDSVFRSAPSVVKSGMNTE